jgi:hypothetical protein
VLDDEQYTGGVQFISYDYDLSTSLIRKFKPSIQPMQRLGRIQASNYTLYTIQATTNSSARHPYDVIAIGAQHNASRTYIEFNQTGNGCLIPSPPSNSSEPFPIIPEDE